MLGSIRRNVGRILTEQGHRAAANTNQVTNSMPYLISVKHSWHKNLNLGSALSLGSYGLAAAAQASDKIALAAVVAQPFALRALAAYGAKKAKPKPPQKEFLFQAIKKHPIAASMIAMTAAIGAGHAMHKRNAEKTEEPAKA